jgi:hypothetical protein
MQRKLKMIILSEQIKIFLFLQNEFKILLILNKLWKENIHQKK